MDPVTVMAVLLRDRFCCLMCGEDLHDSEPTYISLDRLERGGGDSVGNLYASCRPCKKRRPDPAPAPVVKAVKRHGDEAVAKLLRYAKALLKQPTTGGTNGIHRNDQGSPQG